MEKDTPTSSTVVPTVDLSPFLDGGDKSRRKEVMNTISNACQYLGVFNIENHGVPLDNCEKLFELNMKFFSYSDEEKTKSTQEDRIVSGAGYGKMCDKYHDFEYLLMYSPEIFSNGVPAIRSTINHLFINMLFNYEYRKTYYEVFRSLLKTAQILEEIINDNLGLPPNFLKKFNDDRSWDFMMPMYYTKANNSGDIGIVEHQDPNFITITLQNDVSGLEVFEDGKWIPTSPTKLKFVVVVGDLVQVLSGKKYRNVKHKALKNMERSRLAIDFCYFFGPDKWIQPLWFIKGFGRKPTYKGFYFKDYMDLIRENYKNPPPTVEDFIDLTYYEIKPFISRNGIRYIQFP